MSHNSSGHAFEYFSNLFAGKIKIGKFVLLEFCLMYYFLTLFIYFRWKMATNWFCFDSN